MIRDVRTVCYQSLVKFLLQLFTLTDATCPEWQSNEWITDKTREGSNTCKQRIIIIINNYSNPRTVERERYIHCSFATLEQEGGRLRCIWPPPLVKNKGIIHNNSYNKATLHVPTPPPSLERNPAYVLVTSYLNRFVCWAGYNCTSIVTHSRDFPFGIKFNARLGKKEQLIHLTFQNKLHL